MDKKLVDEFEVEVDESQENEALVIYDIATYPSDFTLNGIVEMWKKGDITIPDFQREYVWNIKQASLLIESFLLGLPVPPVFFYIDDKNKNLVIDGQQRILTTAFYFEGYFGFENMQGRRRVFRLQGLDEKSPYYNKKFEELSESDQRKLKNCVLRAINIRQISPIGDCSSVYHIFERLNTGGTPLKPQEIRNVVFRGDIVEKLRSLNENGNWRLIMGTNKLDRHQRDIELILRLFALSYYLEDYEKPMKDYLSKIMEQHCKANTTQFKEFYQNFSKVCEYIIQNLGSKPFHVRGPLSTSTLDAVFCIILKNFDKIPIKLTDLYKTLIADVNFENYTTKGTTDAHTVRARFQLVEKKLVQ